MIKTLYYNNDPYLQGNVIAITDSSGAVKASYEYDAWGKLVSTAPTSSSIGAINPLRYRGYYFDTETGLYYLQSRYYDPEVCRFINADAFASTRQGFVGCNMFAYCLNNPVIFLDSTGRDAASIAAGWGPTMWWLNFVDGPIPIGDIVYWIGFGVAVLYTVIAVDDSASNISSDDIGALYASAYGSTPASPGGPEDDWNNNSNRNWEKVDDKYLKQKLAEQGTDPHSVKYEYLGKKASIKRYDIYVDKGTGQLGIYDKFTNQIIEITYYNIGGR